ncbi:substrate-binding periplasmic protein [Pseudomonas mangiferae]|uniref:ABC transporter substrate-binding protein n=1 Tax=Pseudomonas mangiferae TaxID=2593654 RepID=A0A553GYR0_9PSED|nr:ABC transporter substrate-binding protein [Pseudomonas mangiferae]TRX74637.1 ABC transporter substrate-binding protein [Pseudomonas mangiferae]
MPKTRCVSLVLLLCAFLINSTAWAADAGDVQPVTLLTENFPPFNMAQGGKNFARDPDVSGISTELVREMFKRAGVRYNLSLRFPWDRIYKLTLEKPYYGLFSTTRTPEREALFKWVGPLVKNEWVLLARPDSPIAVKDLKEAAAYRVGGYKNDAVSEYLQTQGVPTSNTLRDQENVTKLERGQIDLWATSDPAGLYLARQAGVTGLKTVLRFKSVEMYLALNKDTPDALVQRLQGALDQMDRDGEAERIRSAYR